MADIHLNLARKWRSKHFGQIVGQELPVSMLKNSLFLNHYFPVYLFSGTHGCGKTTTARVFAAALNCEQLPEFQKNPAYAPFPCQLCASCQAMLAGRHPDFFEIDAASHTGVDTIRTLIEAAQLLPLMGRKKIYLIDEAHMLSKASFNALLKILEEAPPSVVFMLATTEEHKIIETVKSRCFQLFFKPVAAEQLVRYLETICATEQIQADNNGLTLIVAETEGSARDALNLLERVRFAYPAVTHDAVVRVLGHVDEACLVQIVEHALTKTPEQTLRYLQQINYEQMSALYVWRRLHELLRVMLWLHHKVEPPLAIQHMPMLRTLVDACTVAHVQRALELMYKHEAVFLKTTAQHALLEMMLLQMHQQQPELVPQSERVITNLPKQKPAPVEINVVSPVASAATSMPVPVVPQQEDPQARMWQYFVRAIEQLDDPLLCSIFKQGSVQRIDKVAGIVEIQFSKELIFFKELLDETQATWLPLLREHVEAPVSCTALFTGMSTLQTAPPVMVPQQQHAVSHKPAPVVRQQSQQPEWQTQRRTTAQPQTPVEPIIPQSQASQWDKASMVLRHFPGKLTEIKEEK